MRLANLFGLQPRGGLSEEAQKYGRGDVVQDPRFRREGGGGGGGLREREGGRRRRVRRNFGATSEDEGDRGRKRQKTHFSFKTGRFNVPFPDKAALRINISASSYFLFPPKTS